ncbi:hypothetical protein SAMN05421823_106255 [Catalinimonas alkaloidigena]|uniref:Uncharacterized protein n=1 Tax=Catalinimonas alkaloidigena TaxID=1075417 RepID=A0A1G9KV33_9BACT|nr:FAD-dependent oxidoreductase [Catalinimonas alkaloidigena]SDL53165.1 hypothetical protein SAMN05421823_106255 [Catalinimonas alkaloidigena]
MHQQHTLILPPDLAYQEDALRDEVRRRFSLSSDTAVRVARRSIDARGRQVRVNVTVDVGNALPPLIDFVKDYPDVSQADPVVIVGAGPAGLFAALRLIEKGLKPIVLERGQDVRMRRRDLAAINKEHVVNPESNYCFGEGGAGTYSDGKLYTRSKKRGDVRRILEIMVAHGATSEILVDAHPHIGTNKLPNLVMALRESIRDAGGEVHFDTKVTDLLLQEGELRGVVTQAGDRIEGLGVILATGHSARDVFELLHRRGVYLEAKPFAMGVRVEHPQALIDRIQYNCEDRGPYLPASSYALVSQVNFEGLKRGVFSFCMCPGGFIVPAATAPGEVVVNGMSPSRRDSRYANSGIVVSVEPEDWQRFADLGPLAGLALQREVEQRACAVAGGTQNAPAQRLGDFVHRKVSSSLLDTSYQPGLTSVVMDDVLPPFISERLRRGFQDFGRKMRGYFTNDAQIVGVESRTSSPVRIPRDRETLEHVQLKRLYPCGEGAGFAGGIMSAALDGERCAEALAVLYAKKA